MDGQSGSEHSKFFALKLTTRPCHISSSSPSLGAVRRRVVIGIKGELVYCDADRRLSRRCSD